MANKIWVGGARAPLKGPYVRITLTVKRKLVTFFERVSLSARHSELPKVGLGLGLAAPFPFGMAALRNGIFSNCWGHPYHVANRATHVVVSKCRKS